MHPDRVPFAGLTERAAKLIARAPHMPLPEDVARAARRAILDTTACILSGLNDPLAGILIADQIAQGGRAEARVPDPDAARAPHSMTARQAALILGTLGHVDDWDDTQVSRDPNHRYGLLMHPSAPVLGALLALAERARHHGQPLSGGRFICAFAVGVEIACKLSEGSRAAVYERGFQSTSVYGPLGAAAAAAVTLGLDAPRANLALGVAASRAAGLRAQYGRRIKAMHAGFAAEAGVIAVDLVRAGVDAAEAVLDGEWGLPHVLGGPPPPDKVIGNFADPWSLVDPGLSVKPYPSGILTHQTMDAMAALVAAHGVRADAIAGIEIRASSSITQAIRYPRARTPLEAKFCLPALLAMIVIAGRAGPAEFSDAFLARAETRALQERITLRHDPELDRGGHAAIRSALQVRLTDGRVLDAVAPLAYRGGPDHPMSAKDMAAKLAAAATGRLGPAGQERLRDTIAALGTAPDAAVILDALCPAQP